MGDGKRLTLSGRRRIRLLPRKEKVVEKPTEELSPATGFIGVGGFFPGQSGETNAPRGVPTGEFLKKVEAGIRLPVISTYSEEKEEEKEIENENVNIRYPINFQDFNIKGMTIYAHIKYDQNAKGLVYNIIEPPIAETELGMIESIKNYIQEKIDINFSDVRNTNVENYIDKALTRAISYFGYELSPSKKMILRYYVLRDFIGLGKLEPLLSDKNIEDISCDGERVNLYVYHRNPDIGSIRTNVVFNDKNELDSFVNRLSERAGKTISVSHPLLDGTLPNGSRIQATLGSDIARRGSNFTIRIFTDKPLTPVDLITYGTCDTRILAYCWMLIEYSKSFLISGGTATGKTSFLNVLSLFIRPQMKLVSIEDTAELRLPHAHWVPEVSRVSVSSDEQQVDMFKLLKESLRQRPDYIIVGEVRGKEAYVLFQQIAVGHPGLSTIHAEDFNKLVDRMTTNPINLPGNLLENLDVVIFIKRVKRGRKFIRRISSLVEVIGFDQKIGFPVKNEVFVWNPIEDKFDTKNNSVILREISESTGLPQRDVIEEIEKRSKIINWMLERKINDYREVGAVVEAFYTNQERLLDKIEEGA